MPHIDPAKATPVAAVLPFVPTTSDTLTSSAVGAAPAPVEHVRPELQEMLPQYVMVRDCVLGSAHVKKKAAAYLPMPEGAALDPYSGAPRYTAYLLRAVFYNVTRRTLQGLTGQVALKPATIKVPPALDAVVKDATGSGISLEQLGLQLVAENVAVGRAGVLADYPVTDRPTTRQEQREGSVRPTITAYPAEAIINWRTETIGARTVLSLVVLAETHDASDDGFKVEVRPQIRVLRLVDGKYSVTLWRKELSGTWTEEPATFPTDAKGNSLTEIPFMFIGSLNNDAAIDPAPLYDMADLNIAHYRNSADYEEAVFMSGQPTPVITGLDQAWWENVLKGKITFGSRAGIPLPADATFELVQMQANGAAKEAMDQKEAQMKALGAKLVEIQKVQTTATESKMDEVSETSALQRMVKNVSAAVLWALEWCAIFDGSTTVNRDEQDADKKTINFELNTDFDFSGVAPDEVTSAINAWNQNAITFLEMRGTLRRAGLATEDDEKAKADIRDEKMENIKVFGDPNNPETPNSFGGGNNDPGAEDDDEELSDE